MSHFFKHPSAIVASDQIGPGTRIWAFSHVLKGARLGRDCNVGEHCYIENHVSIGDEVVIKNGVAVWEGVELGNRVLVGPNAVFTNDLIPRSKLFKGYVRTLVREGASIGANATIVCGIEIGRYALIGAGAVVTRNVPDFAIVFGNPARLRGYVCTCGEKLTLNADDSAVCRCGATYKRRNDQLSPLDLAASEAQRQSGDPM